MNIKAKKISILSIFLILTIATFSQESGTMVISPDNVPSEVKFSFNESYPEATIKKWWLIDKDYQAEQVTNNRIYKVLINSSGGIIEERKELFYPEELPEKVINGFKKTEYKYWDVQEAHETENTSENLFYEIKVSKDGRFQIIYFKPNGELDEKSLSTF